MFADDGGNAFGAAAGQSTGTRLLSSAFSYYPHGQREGDMNDQPGKRFREARIEGIKPHFLSDTKPKYTAPWDQIPAWEHESAAAALQASLVR